MASCIPTSGPSCRSRRAALSCSCWVSERFMSRAFSSASRVFYCCTPRPDWGGNAMAVLPDRGTRHRAAPGPGPRGARGPRRPASVDGEGRDLDRLAVPLPGDRRPQVILLLGGLEGGHRLLVARGVELQVGAVRGDEPVSALLALEGALGGVGIGVRLHFSDAVRVDDGDVFPGIRREHGEGKAQTGRDERDERDSLHLLLLLLMRPFFPWPRSAGPGRRRQWRSPRPGPPGR